MLVMRDAVKQVRI